MDARRIDGRGLVSEVRHAARAHGRTWEALVPSQFEINLDAEGAEEAAYAEMAQAKRRLRDHICESYACRKRAASSAAMQPVPAAVIAWR